MVNMGNQYADDPQMQQKIREKAMEALKYLVSLVNDVLDMNKLQSGELKDQQILFDLTMVLRELNQIYDERAAKKGIRYEVDWKKKLSRLLLRIPVCIRSSPHRHSIRFRSIITAEMNDSSWSRT